MDMMSLQATVDANLSTFYANMQTQMMNAMKNMQSASSEGAFGGAEAVDGKEGGRVVIWHAEKGFGFLKPDKGGDDIFVHVTNLQDGDALREGDPVRFHIRYDEKASKYRAEEVTGAWWERELERAKKEERRRDSRSRGRGRR